MEGKMRSGGKYAQSHSSNIPPKYVQILVLGAISPVSPKLRLRSHLRCTKTEYHRSSRSRIREAQSFKNGLEENTKARITRVAEQFFYGYDLIYDITAGLADSRGYETEKHDVRALIRDFHDHL